jgi:hypothetical protein
MIPTQAGLGEAHEDGVGLPQGAGPKNPTAFLSLVGKVLPLDVNANHSGGVRVIHVPFPKSALDE